MSERIIASEYVSYGHPDKIADQIADAILDALLKEDKDTRSGIEVMVKDNIVVLGGEVRTNAKVNYDSVVRKVFEKLMFPESHHLSPDDIKVINLIGKQSNEINRGVDKSSTDIGAGDQGFVVGFASNDTDVYLPLGVYLAKKICEAVVCPYRSYTPLGPDCKTQVIVKYDCDTNESRLLSILVSTMYEGYELEYVRDFITEHIRKNRFVLPEDIYNKYIKDNEELVITVNPCGAWNIGGPVSDCGVTGRKIVVDQFGGYCNVGGGAFSGKDMTKVDRSAAYMARYLAKNIVAAGLCDTAKVELSYMIGVAKPSSINVEMNRNSELSGIIASIIEENIDITPYGIMTRFNYAYPRYEFIATFGAYGYDTQTTANDTEYFPWEKTDFAEELKNRLKNTISHNNK